MGGEEYRDIANAMGVNNVQQLSLAAARKAAINAVKQFNSDVHIPEKLREVGVKQEDIVALAQAAFADVCTGGNPRETSVEDIVKLYQTIY